MTFSNIILVLTVTCTALVAGLFYGFSCSLVHGLEPLSGEAYIGAMQSINRAIQDPVFFVCFFGALLLLPETLT
ncbi:MAG: hypothetical protein WKI04_04145 [Ferruginibacter sp.]